MPCRVLIADDVEALRLLWRRLLEEDTQIEVVGEAPDGAAALEAARSLRPDVVVMDLSMPGMDGLQVIQRIVAELPETRVVVASGFSAGRLAPLALELGAAAYFEKGSPASGLLELVLAACASPPPGRSSRRT